MKVYRYPSDEELDNLLKRPVRDAADLNATVSAVLDDVRTRGDAAVREYEARFDHVQLGALAVTPEEMAQAETLVSDELKGALRLAHQNIEKFHAAQRFEGEKVQVTEGVTCWQKAVPIERVGLYIPGGTAPLFSTVLMLATPARIAGCSEIVLCTPPRPDGTVNPAILVAARIAGVSRIFKIGGVQAIGAMAYGTESVPRVYKIFGPGNQFVMCAKQQVSLHDVAIDMPAGPSEVEVLADESSNPAFVAADLLSQAEHDPLASSIVITTSAALAEKTAAEVEKQLAALPRKAIAGASIERNGMIVVAEDMMQAIRFANLSAPEHLELLVAQPFQLLPYIRHAGAVFLGAYSPEPLGDYFAGPDHILPTGGTARFYSVLNVETFMKRTSFISYTQPALQNVSDDIVRLAEAEGLQAHANAIRLRGGK